MLNIVILHCWKWYLNYFNWPHVDHSTSSKTSVNGICRSTLKRLTGLSWENLCVTCAFFCNHGFRLRAQKYFALRNSNSETESGKVDELLILLPVVRFVEIDTIRVVPWYPFILRILDFSIPSTVLPGSSTSPFLKMVAICFNSFLFFELQARGGTMVGGETHGAMIGARWHSMPSPWKRSHVDTWEVIWNNMMIFDNTICMQGVKQSFQLNFHSRYHRNSFDIRLIARTFWAKSRSNTIYTSHHMSISSSWFVSFPKGNKPLWKCPMPVW